ncbi:uncharacterized protein LOC136075133 [Hydra vulgaris]|uniref:Uncharacterized protein LOC136075133 n=1 Tax=Hydra vulgaris TaxID=6087 RepID=A0ABM4B3Y4_HYDVU
MEAVLHNESFQIKLSELFAQDWFKIGASLNVELNKLVGIRDDYIVFRKQENKAHEMIQEWFKIDENPTFEKLKLAIKSIPNFKLLKEVEDLAKRFSTMPPVLSKGAPNPENDYQILLTHQIIGRVGHFIGVKFDLFGRHLGLSGHDVSNIDADKHNAQAKAIAVIDMWIERNGISKWEQLKKELLLFGHKNTVEIIEKDFLINNP